MSSLFASIHRGDAVPVHAALDSLSPLTRPQVTRRWSALSAHSLKSTSQAAGLELAIRAVDLTTLEGADSPDRVRRLVARAAMPDQEDSSCPRPAAVCVYPNLVEVARTTLDRMGVNDVSVASVAGAFPSGLAPLEARLSEIRQAVDSGADEIDIVLDRSLFLAGEYEQVLDELRQARAAAGRARLKTILETGELGSVENIWRASWLAAAAGTDFLKTSTGKSAVGATPEAVWTLATCASRFNAATGCDVGVKISGGVRSAKEALRLMLLVADAAGPSSLDPHRFRLGASTLLDDLCAQRRYHRTGSYWGPEYFPMG